MTRSILSAIVFLTASIQLAGQSPSQAAVPGMKIFRPACDSIQNYMAPRAWSDLPIYVRSARVSGKGKNAVLVINACMEMAFYPFREGDVEHIYKIMADMMPEKYCQYRKRFRIMSNNRNLKAYTPGYYSKNGGKLYVEEHRQRAASRRGTKPLVTPLSRPYEIKKGLSLRHIALWHSHGCYYNTALGRWIWQRGRIFGTVEDVYTQSYVIPFLVPMLENAGAVVMMPRERDFNPCEVIVDNDSPSSGYSETGSWSDAQGSGFANSGEPYPHGRNPFREGSARMTATANGPGQKASAVWKPDIPQDGEYAVYVSYRSLGSSSSEAIYEVLHGGVVSKFAVNQKIGGGTWIYLGKFHFRKGRRDDQCVRLKSSGSGVVTADAVKFGGGMGNVTRSSLHGCDSATVSGHPRFNEAARYWLQWAGFADTVYSASDGRNDYTDDIRCHGKWVNTLLDDYGIPVDAALAFHTDAGLCQDADSTVGTLAIHTWKYRNSDRYSNGERRFLGRDYADMVQSQVVGDLRALYDPNWTRRGLWDRPYGECSTPEVPSFILELLSHQNFNDMRYGLDPQFRFDVSRAVYKGILRFLSWLNDEPFVVQPLPVKEFAVKVQKVGDKNYAVLSWKPVTDPLEPTARPDKFIVYTREDNGSFDNGRVVESDKARIEMRKGVLYSFKVAALNAGGAGFPSETLCAAVASNGGGTPRTVMIVNNFTRVCGPSSFMSQDSLSAGFRYDEDAGVPYIADAAYCGDQYEFRRSEAWMSDDYPGFGASGKDYDRSTVAGNTFDFAAVHAEAFLKAGFTVVSASRAAILSSAATMNDYPVVDIICGKQKKSTPLLVRGDPADFSVFPAALREAIQKYAAHGGAMLISGSYIASDLMSEPDSTAARRFAEETLKLRPEGRVADSCRTVTFSQCRFSFFRKPNPVRYHIERPDGIAPSGRGSSSILQYGDGTPSAVKSQTDKCRIISLGFPIEALENQEQIDRLVESLSKLF